MDGYTTIETIGILIVGAVLVYATLWLLALAMYGIMTIISYIITGKGLK